MQQQQKIGNSNQHNGLPDNQNEQNSNPPKPRPNNQQGEKPLVTDDGGNAVDKLFDSAGKGYSEHKPTDAHSNVPVPDEQTTSKAPEAQDSGTEKVYGVAGKPHQNRHSYDISHQMEHEEKEDRESRAQRVAQSVKANG